MGANAKVVNVVGNPAPWPVHVAGDKGYRANWIVNCLIGRDTNPVIPSKENQGQRTFIKRLTGFLRESPQLPTLVPAAANTPIESL